MYNRTLIRLSILNSHTLNSLFHLKKCPTCPYQRIYSHLQSVQYCSIHLFTGGIDPVLSIESSHNDLPWKGTRQDNVDISKEPLIIASRLITKHKTKQALRGDRESVPHEEVLYSTEELSECVNLFK